MRVVMKNICLFCCCLAVAACRTTLEELDFFEVKTLRPEAGLQLGQVLLRDSLIGLGPQGVDDHGFWWSENPADLENPNPQTARIAFGPTRQAGISDTLIALSDETKTYYFRAYALRGGRSFLAPQTPAFSLGLRLAIEDSLTVYANDRARFVIQVRGLDRLRASASEYGFTWSDNNAVPNPDVDPTRYKGPLGRDGLFRDSIDGLIPGKTYRIRAFLKAGQATFFSPVAILRVRETWTPTSAPFGGKKVWGAFTVATDDRALVGCGVSGGLPSNGLISGGAGNELTEIWEFSPTTQTWSAWNIPVPDGDFARFNAVAFVLNRQLYVGTGGQKNNQISGDFYQFDLDSEQYVRKFNNVPGALSRMNAVAFVLDGKAYVGTGNTLSAGNIQKNLDDFWTYDPLADHWDTIPRLPVLDTSGQVLALGRRSATSFVIGNRAYVMGGYRSDQNLVGISGLLLSDCQAYDPALHQWLPMARFPGEPRSDAAAFVLGRRAFVGLGYGATGGFLSDWWSFNPDAGPRGAWEKVGPHFEPGRADACAFALQNQGYLFGGRTIKPTNTGYSGFILGDAWLFRRE